MTNNKPQEEEKLFQDIRKIIVKSRKEILKTLDSVGARDSITDPDVIDFLGLSQNTPKKEKAVNQKK